MRVACLQCVRLMRQRIIDKDEPVASIVTQSATLLSSKLEECSRMSDIMTFPVMLPVEIKVGTTLYVCVL
jgi:hypothetical protein